MNSIEATIGGLLARWVAAVHRHAVWVTVSMILVTVALAFYVAGGLDDSGASLNVLEAYDPSGNTWMALAPLGTPRDNPACASLDGLLYVFGGRTRLSDGTEVEPRLTTVEVYDPLTNMWSDLAPMPTGRRTIHCWWCRVRSRRARATARAGSSRPGRRA